MSSTFAELGVPADLAGRLAQRGITTAFPIQASSIPPALEGRDVCGRAPTGSGKTLAFGLPLAARVERARPHRPKALVLVPTRELAAQIHTELAPLLKARRRTAATFYGGVGFGPQLQALRKGVDVAVACPGRLSDLVSRGSFVLDDVQLVVVDEADRMADMGFLPVVRRILDAVAPDRQTLLFSATLDGDVDVIVRNYQRDPVRCAVEPPAGEADLTVHHFVDTTREGRIERTAELVGEHGSTVVFCRTKRGADRVARQLGRAGVSAVAIHGDRSQGQRDRALASFARGGAQALVATDVAARGIHVDDVGCVIHFDLAADAKDYLHRSGRTGRAGARGVVITLVTEQDRAKARQLQHAVLGTGSSKDRPKTARPRRGDGAPRAHQRPTRRGQRPRQRQRR